MGLAFQLGHIGLPQMSYHFMMKRILYQLNKARLTMNWLHRVFPMPAHPKELSSLWNLIERVARSRGPHELVKFMKAHRLAFIIFLAGGNERVPGVSYNSKGLPKFLTKLPAKWWSSPKPRGLAVLLTVLS